MNWAEHVKNRNAFPLGELEKYEGQHVAWSLDGTRILAGHEDPLRLNAALEAAGYRSDAYVLSFVAFDSYIGSAAFGEAAFSVHHI
jgi:hypothetical protein